MFLKTSVKSEGRVKARKVARSNPSSSNAIRLSCFCGDDVRDACDCDPLSWELEPPMETASLCALGVSSVSNSSTSHRCRLGVEGISSLSPSDPRRQLEGVGEGSADVRLRFRGVDATAGRIGTSPPSIDRSQRQIEAVFAHITIRAMTGDSCPA